MRIIRNHILVSKDNYFNVLLYTPMLITKQKVCWGKSCANCEVLCVTDRGQRSTYMHAVKTPLGQGMPLKADNVCKFSYKLTHLIYTSIHTIEFVSWTYTEYVLGFSTLKSGFYVCITRHEFCFRNERKGVNIIKRK